MKDNLEQLVRDNRAAFDDKEPGKKVWDKIARRLDNKNSYEWIWKAAAVVFFLSTVGLGVFQYKSNSSVNFTAQQEQINTEFQSIENFYIEMISEKKSMIYDFEADNQIIDQTFEQDLQKLDAMYQVLKEELKANPSKQVVDALILNLLVRIDILNAQLQELDEADTESEGGKGQINV